MTVFYYAEITIIVQWQDFPYPQQSTGVKYYGVAMVMSIFNLYSTITAWGRENEVKAFKNMLTQVTTLFFVYHSYVHYSVFK